MVLLGVGIAVFRGGGINPPLGGVTPTAAVNGKMVEAWAQAESEKAARDFVLNSQSFRASGSDLELKAGTPLYCGEGCWEFTYVFKVKGVSRRMVVAIKNGQIESAVTDGKIDELRAAVK